MLRVEISIKLWTWYWYPHICHCSEDKCTKSYKWKWRKNEEEKFPPQNVIPMQLQLEIISRWFFKNPPTITTWFSKLDKFPFFPLSFFNIHYQSPAMKYILGLFPLLLSKVGLFLTNLTNVEYYKLLFTCHAQLL